MADNFRRKCLKCGRSPKEDSGINLYRFPYPGPTNILRCESWAKFCFPGDAWQSNDFHKKLYAEHRMLCNKHFKESAFIDFVKKKLNRNAVPEDECNEQPTLSALIGDNISPKPALHCQDSSQILMDITNVERDHKHVPEQSQHIIEPVPGPSTSKCDVLEPQPRLSEILKDITNIESVATSTSEISAKNRVPSKREMELNKKCRLYVKRIWKLRNSVKKQNNLDKLNILHEDRSYQKLVKRLTPSFAILLQSQLKNVRRNRKGRRWSLDEKIIALRLYKRSPMCYRLLRGMWCLPTPATLKSLLGQFNITIGINEKILNALEDHVKNLQPSDKEFILMFDEMSIRKHLEYKCKQDLIEGFQDHGLQHGRSEQIATHALVFMVAGIRKKEKQPIAFYLSSSYVTADRLAVLIKEVLHACFNIGLTISATICDMDGVNRRALTVLGATKDKPYFSFLNNEVVTIFDPPHLLKCFRNLFLKYNVKCSTNIMSNDQTGQGLAKWSHIKDFYDNDNQNKNFVFAPALRKEHLNPNAKEKMRVKLAAQVLSHSVAAGMFAKIAEGALPSDATATADLISNMDKLFDSLNSERPDLRRGKPYATNLSNTSPHLNFFLAVKKLFSNLEFVGCVRTPPSQQGWIWSINAIERLWKNLISKHKNIKTLSTRRLQQDPLENLFGIIRGNCGANSNPTVGQFIAGLKTAIMSNLAHMSRGNCEQDENDAILQNFKKILSPTYIRTAEDPKQKENRIEASVSLVADSLDESFAELSSTESAELQACAYVCGFLLKRKRNKCKTCEEFLISKETNNEMFNYMQFKEYSDMKKALIYASKELVNCVESCATIINDLLNRKGHTVDVKKSILENCYKNVNFHFIKCHFDENVQFIANNVFHISVKRFCTVKNREFRDATSTMSLKKKIDIIKHK